jgi:hypothetical protein
MNHFRLLVFQYALLVSAVLLFSGCASYGPMSYGPMIDDGKALDISQGTAIIVNPEIFHDMQIYFDGHRIYWHNFKDGTAIVPCGIHMLSNKDVDGRVEVFANLQEPSQYSPSYKIWYVNQVTVGGEKVVFDFKPNKRYKIISRYPEVAIRKDKSIFVYPRDAHYEIKDGKYYLYPYYPLQVVPVD